MLAVTVDDYLKRIGVDGPPPTADLAALEQLQTAHIVAVPFENLDVFARTGVSTSLDWSLPKLVDRRRGGWCFELNGGFGWLLRQLGFTVDYVSCRVFGDGEWGPPLDHCALVVHIAGARLFVDVGFGDCCMVPVALTDGEHHGVPRRVRITCDGDEFRLAELGLDGNWGDQLWGSVQPRSLDDFLPRSDFLQTEPGLAWTRKPFATRATSADGSRVTVRDGLLRVREGCGEFVDHPIGDHEFARLLTEHFGL